MHKQTTPDGTSGIRSENGPRSARISVESFRIRVTQVQPLDEYLLDLTFSNGQRRRFDLKPYLDLPAFAILHNTVRFQQARVVAGAVSWPAPEHPCGEVDLCSSTLWAESEPVAEPAAESA